MIILIPNTSTVAKSAIETVSQTLIMKEIIECVPSQAGARLETKQVPFIPKGRLQPNPPGSLKNKRSGTRKKKIVSTLTMEGEEPTIKIHLPNDIPPKSPNALTNRPTRMKSIHW